MSATVNWKTYDTGAIASPIASNGRFRLASPASVLGTPSLAMQSAGQLAVVNAYIDGGERIAATLTVSGTALVPIVNTAGQPFTAQDLFGLSIEVTGINGGEVLYTTDEPNGSPSAPFTTATVRNAAAPFPAGSTVDVSGGAGAVNITYKLKEGATGAIDADWQVFGAGGTSRTRRAFASWTPWAVTNALSTGSTTDKAVQTNVRAPISKFHRVRFWLGNNSQVAAYTGWQGFNLAVSNAGASCQPSVGGNVGTDPTAGWIAAVGPLSIPLASSVAPTLYASPWIDIPSIPATDGGRPWLFFRGQRTVAGAAHGLETIADDSLGTLHVTKVIADATGASLGASSSASATTFDGTATVNYSHILRIDFVGETDSASIDFVGASTIAGHPGTDNNEINWAMKSIIALRALGLHVGSVFGTAGLSTASIYQNVQTMITVSISDFIVMPIFSSNGGFTPPAVSLQVMWYFSARAQARAIGKEVIALLLPHNAAMDGGTNEATRIAAIAEIIDSGAPCIDGRVAIGDPVYNRNKWLATDSDDGTHPNAAGKLKLTAWMPAAVDSVRKSYPFGY